MISAAELLSPVSAIAPVAAMTLVEAQAATISLAVATIDRGFDWRTFSVVRHRDASSDGCWFVRLEWLERSPLVQLLDAPHGRVYFASAAEGVAWLDRCVERREALKRGRWEAAEAADPFSLRNDRPKHKPATFASTPARQRQLLDGLGCLPGQADLF